MPSALAIRMGFTQVVGEFLQTDSEPFLTESECERDRLRGF